MKKIFFLLVVAVLLASCQAAPTPTPAASTPIPPTEVPVPTPTPADTEILAASIYNVAGIWYAENGTVLDIRKDGFDLKISVYTSVTDPWRNFATATGKFEDGKLIYLTVDGDCVGTEQATYEIYIVEHDGHVIGMRPKLVGEDLCTTRKDTLDHKLLEYVGVLFFLGRK